MAPSGDARRIGGEHGSSAVDNYPAALAVDSQDHDRRCWASLRKPLEDLGSRRRRGPTSQNLAAATAKWGNSDIRSIIGASFRAGGGACSGAALGPAQ